MSTAVSNKLMSVLRTTRGGILAAVLAVVLSVPLTLLPAQPAHAAFNPGLVCNKSSVSIWATIQPLNGNWYAGKIYPGQCTNRIYQDVEAVWGRHCNQYGQNCNYVAWKVNGWTTTVVYNGYIMPVSPGRTLFRSGSGYFTVSSSWPRPSLSSIGYDLR